METYFQNDWVIMRASWIPALFFENTVLNPLLANVFQLFQFENFPLYSTLGIAQDLLAPQVLQQYLTKYENK